MKEQIDQKVQEILAKVQEMLDAGTNNINVSGRMFIGHVHNDRDNFVFATNMITQNAEFNYMSASFTFKVCHVTAQGKIDPVPNLYASIWFVHILNTFPEWNSVQQTLQVDMSWYPTELEGDK
jgi:hypothetical protein